MDDLKAMFAGVWDIFTLEFTLYGYTISWFNVFAVTAICGIILWAIWRFAE